MTWMLCFSLLDLVLLLLTLLPLWRHEAWWVRGLDFPRLQLLILAFLIAISGTLLLDLTRPGSWILIAIALFCLLFQAWWIFPYTRLYANEVATSGRSSNSNRIAIITANVLTPNRNAPGLVDLVRQHNPDILLTLETDDWWESQLESLEVDYTYCVKCPQDNLYGMHLYSRLPLSNSNVEFLVEDGVPSIHTRVRLRSGRELRLHCLHPAPPSPTENASSSERDAELILLGKDLQNYADPVIVTGDLNDVAWSDTTRLFRKISGLLDPRVGRGFYNSYHAGIWFIRWPLDHLFHSSHFELSTMQRLPGFGSDHFAIYTELDYCAGSDNDNKGIEATREDHDRAQAKLDNQGVDSKNVPAA